MVVVEGAVKRVMKMVMMMMVMTVIYDKSTREQALSPV